MSTKQLPQVKSEHEEQNSQLNFQLGHIKANTNSFWLAIVFLITFSICFITYIFCNTFIQISNQYNKSLTEILLKTNHK